MPFTQAELANSFNSLLEFNLKPGRAFDQNIQAKPTLARFDRSSETMPGGLGLVCTLRVQSGQGGGSMAGYTHDDQVTYYNPIGVKTVKYTAREHHIGMGLTHTELKEYGIQVTEDGASQTTSNKSDQEMFVLVNGMDNKVKMFAEDYAVSWNGLVWGDGTADAKSLAGIRSLILDVPTTGSTGGLSRPANGWWRNRAATAAFGSAGGQGAITSSTANGGALLSFLERERLQIVRFANGGVQHYCPCGSAWLDAMKTELRANGRYSENGFRSAASNDGAMASADSVPFGNWTFEYDPTLDDLGLSKRAYILDMRRVKLRYVAGENKKKHNPARPHDRYVMYRALTTTATMTAEQLNTSAVYDIA